MRELPEQRLEGPKQALAPSDRRQRHTHHSEKQWRSQKQHMRPRHVNKTFTNDLARR
jgi:hypothetical protein